MDNFQDVEFGNVKTIWINSSEKYFHKNIHISLFNKYKNKKSKLYFEDRIAVLSYFLF